MNKIRRKKDMISSIGRGSAVMLSILFLLSVLSGCAEKERETETNLPEEVGQSGEAEQSETAGMPEGVEQPGGAEEPQVVKPLRETRQSEDEDLSETEEGNADVPPQGIPEDSGEAAIPEIPEDWERVDSFLMYPFRAYRAAERSGNRRLTSLYTILPDTGESVRFRSMGFDYDTGIVEIWDMIQHELLFTAEAVLNEDGEPENEDYYDHILRCGGWPKISRDVFGKIVYTGADYALSETEYADKEEFLKAMGFAGEEPFYACDGDMWGHSALELYYDESSGKGCGLSYAYNMSYEGELMPKAVYGWSFDHVGHGEFVHDPYLLEMIGGGTGKGFPDYTETYQYRTDGRLRRFLTEGMMDHESGASMTMLLELRYEYRDDGSLACRRYYHNHLVRSSTDMITNSYYDEQERLVYEYHYITHGSVEHYYIYRNGSSLPAYCLILDSYGTYGVWLIEYEN